YKMIVVPLSEITKEKQVTNVKLFVILPVIAFIFNNLMYALFSATSAIINFSTVDKSGMKEYLQSDPRGEAAEKILRILLECMRAQTIVYIYPSIVTAVVLIIAVSTIVKNISYMNETIRAHRQVKALSVEVMEALAHTIDAKDEYTRGHSVRVAKYSKMIAQKMGLPAEECENVYYMGLLHDIGKIGVPNEIINKPARLTDDEYGVIKKHPMTGFDILAEIKTRPDLATGARWHHERFDGTGYPDHKKGGEIPLPARIIAVADSYDAMTSNRSYRKFLPQDVVRDEIEVNIGTQFDEKPAKAMLEIMDEDTEYTLHE
ncbi:MAG: HD-GYP domain-containing protein, partial [Lachnospiraceae bacterium]|nr:HD-GYP domain-containing protein [Lachnospiraceae bacterium]